MNSMVRLSLEHLRHLVALGEERNFTRAAQRSHIAQPPFSRSIRVLEDVVGVPLVLDARARPVQLTDAGHDLVRHARSVLSDLEAGVLAVRHRGGALRHLRVGFIEYAYTVLGPTVLSDFARGQPDLLTEPFDAVPLDLEAALATRQVDAQFIAFSDEFHISGSSPLRELVIRQEPLALLLSVEHPLAQCAEIGFAELARQRLVMFDRARAPTVYDAVLRGFSRRGVRPQIEITVLLFQTMLNAVRSTRCIGLAPSTLRGAELPGVRVVPIAAAEAPQVRLSLVWTARNDCAVLPAFIAHVQAHAARCAGTAAAPSPARRRGARPTTSR